MWLDGGTVDCKATGSSACTLEAYKEALYTPAMAAMPRSQDPNNLLVPQAAEPRASRPDRTCFLGMPLAAVRVVHVPRQPEALNPRGQPPAANAMYSYQATCLLASGLCNFSRCATARSPVTGQLETATLQLCAVSWWLW